MWEFGVVSWQTVIAHLQCGHSSWEPTADTQSWRVTQEQMSSAGRWERGARWLKRGDKGGFTFWERKMMEEKNTRQLITLSTASHPAEEGSPFSFQVTSSENGSCKSKQCVFQQQFWTGTDTVRAVTGEGEKLCSKWFNVFSQGFFLCACSVIALLLPTPFYLSYYIKAMIMVPKKNPPHTGKYLYSDLCAAWRHSKVSVSHHN